MVATDLERFSDRGGLEPCDRARGSDKNVMSRLVVVDAACYVKCEPWLHVGYALLNDFAPFPRDYHVPALCGNYQGCQRRELRCDTAHAIQNRVLCVLTFGQDRIFQLQAAQFWTPHSSRYAESNVVIFLVVGGQMRAIDALAWLDRGLRTTSAEV